ncbi:dTDP-L-rhamnose 4-epimerase [Tangfeifania diversioriginum]|uniref:dTDP-L-rhamnose 4-epimerase n=1 Tax=Tangfeifania diversioriginum TaxID=1168035 RepID=A0A1M6GR97_9BACT|nr:NAD-dependent epimerase/dehydratase family protein [Tangfeifania diversioriginum]SHJ12471.1 dTDP-L-rhamnose 4-epimerase [Tangfeifania diversioriginum]
MKILITGGAGFIGSYFTNLLYEEGHEVFIIDNLNPQIHGQFKYDSFLYKSILNKAEFIEEDILESKYLNTIVNKVDYVVHLAAETGTGQSMYDISNCVKTNSFGTAVLLESIIKNRSNIKKFILASSRAVYGEGKYYCIEHGNVYPDARKIEDMQKGQFECKCPFCDREVSSLATDEKSAISPKSIYGITKFNQEQLVKTLCESINLPYTIFRFQNVYGKGQSVNNPYTGILAIFSKLLLENKEINVFEDGLESRDFIHVNDIVNAIYYDLLINKKNKIYNVGTGQKTTVLEIVNLIFKNIQSNAGYQVTGSFRAGDIRHNFADIQAIQKDLNFKPAIKLEEGICSLIDWIIISNEAEIFKKYEKSLEEMKNFNLYFEHNVK